MPTERRTIEVSRRDQAIAAPRTARIRAAFAGEYRRYRPRDADSAAILRELGTPERLIGPVR